jgi:uncharacterized protein (TIGR01244 family)
MRFQSIVRNANLAMLLVGVMITGCAKPAFGPMAVEVAGVRNVVQDGDVFIAGEATRDGLTAMKARGVTAVIDLRDDPAETAIESAAAKELGLHYINIPVQADQITPDMAASLVEEMNRRKGEKVLLHCSGGNRAAAMYGLYLGRSEQCSVDEALNRAKAAGLRNPKTEVQLKARLADVKGSERAK